MKTVTELSRYVISLSVDKKRLEREIEEELAKNVKIVRLNAKLARLKEDEEARRLELLELMRLEEVQNYKDEIATVFRGVRQTLEVEPEYKKKVEHLLKAGEKVKHFQLKETDYISVRMAS